MGACEIPFAVGEAKARDVVDFVGAQLTACPATGGGGLGVEIAQVDLLQRSPVVIAGYADVIVLSEEGDALQGFGAVADNVAKAPDVLGPSPAVEVLEHGLERSQIAVDVGEDGITHVYSG